MKTTVFRKVLAAILSMAALAAVAGCATGNAGPSQNPDAGPVPYKFAMIAPLTGDSAQYGLAFKNSLEILVEKTNADGGINGRPVQVAYYDDKKDPKETLNIANKIISDDSILGVIGSQTSSCSMAAAPVFQKEGVLMISPQASHPDFTAIGDYIFRLQLPTSYESAKTAEYMVESAGHKNIAIIYSNDDWGVSVNEQFTDRAEELGAKVVASETFITGQTKDFSPLISKIKTMDCDALFLVSLYAEGAQILQQCDALDLVVPVYSTNTFYKQEFLDVAGKHAEGVIMVNSFALHNDDPKYLHLEEEYKKRTNSTVDTYVTQSYDSLALMLDAIRAVGDDPAAMRDHIASLQDYHGVSGVFSFNENRDPEKKLFLFTVKDGQYVQMDHVID